jgi:hypothetical protein
MGASGWQHFVPYEPDLGHALQQLREDVFRRGVFYARPGGGAAATIEALLERNGEDGTHSVLDVHRVTEEPIEPSALAWHAAVLAQTGAPPPPDELHQHLMAESRFWGAAAPLSDDQLVATFESTRPDHATVEAAAIKLHGVIVRGGAVYVLVYEGSSSTPSEIFFAGITGD